MLSKQSFRWVRCAKRRLTSSRQLPKADSAIVDYRKMASSLLSDDIDDRPYAYVGNIDGSVPVSQILRLCNSVTDDKTAVFKITRQQDTENTPYLKLHFNSRKARQSVLDQLSGYIFKGRLVVPRYSIKNTHKLFLGNIDVSTTDDEIKQLCMSVGEVSDVDTLEVSRGRERPSGIPMNQCFVFFYSELARNRVAEKLNNSQFKDRTLSAEVVSAQKPDHAKSAARTVHLRNTPVDMPDDQLMAALNDLIGESIIKWIQQKKTVNGDHLGRVNLFFYSADHASKAMEKLKSKLFYGKLLKATPFKEKKF